MDLIYLDHNATTRPADAVAAAMAEANEAFWGNPTSVHRLGQLARQKVELAREEVAYLIGAKPREIVFTSGGTESVQLAVEGAIGGMAGGGEAVRLLTTRVEHAAVRELAERLGEGEREGGVEVGWLPVDGDGRVTEAGLSAALESAVELGASGLTVLSVQWANNETGVVQPMAMIRDALAAARGRGGRVIWHVDGTQWVGKAPTGIGGAGIDVLTFAGHKFYGPKGVGVVWARRGVRLRAVQVGGPQERERRGGTENSVGIIGMGEAARLASEWLADPSEAERLAAERDRFERVLIERCAAAGVTAEVNGAGVERLWNTSSVAFVGLAAEAILVGLSERGVCASAGAACSSGSLEPSPVLLAMGMAEPRAHGTVRFSLGRGTTRAELDAAADAAVEVVSGLARAMPV
ncbi:MAG: cysteine desulfurase family protein [Planctomycetota bacterium]